jgi:hypothetical protein
MPTLPDFIAPCLPTKAPHPPTGALWVHEIKHDGFRIIARKDGNRVRLYSRVGNDLTDCFPLIVEALASLRSRSAILDGEAVACDDDGISNFDRLRGGRPRFAPAARAPGRTLEESARNLGTPEGDEIGELALAADAASLPWNATEVSGLIFAEVCSAAS